MLPDVSATLANVPSWKTVVQASEVVKETSKTVLEVGLVAKACYNEDALTVIESVIG